VYKNFFSPYIREIVFAQPVKWYNANIDLVPADGQEVFVFNSDIYYVSIYDAKENLFRLRDDKKSFFDPRKNLIYWTEFTNPGE
jgi:hypothetical protein